MKRTRWAPPYHHHRAEDFVPGFSKEEEKSMSLTELMDASKGLTNMAIAHEIEVDKDFTLQKIQPANAVENR